MALFVTFDGPKSVGKTTLISLAQQSLSELSATVEVVAEKELLAKLIGQELLQAYSSLRESPSAANDRKIASLHLRGRVLLTNTYLRDCAADIILIDRWYPSEAAFRSFIDAAATITANLKAGVRVPDIAFAMVCKPEASWRRAQLRKRRLDSKIIHSYSEHKDSSERFERLASQYGWFLLRSDCSSPRQLCDTVVEKIVTHRARGPSQTTYCP